jgi:hypothetical protein
MEGAVRLKNVQQELGADQGIEPNTCLYELMQTRLALKNNESTCLFGTHSTAGLSHGIEIENLLSRPAAGHPTEKLPSAELF